MTMETSTIGWPPWLTIFLILIDLWTIAHGHALNFDMISSDLEVSKRNQSRWPSNCTGFYGHHILWNSSKLITGVGHKLQTDLFTGSAGSYHKTKCFRPRLQSPASVKSTEHVRASDLQWSFLTTSENCLLAWSYCLYARKNAELYSHLSAIYIPRTEQSWEWESLIVFSQSWSSYPGISELVFDRMSHRNSFYHVMFPPIFKEEKKRASPRRRWEGAWLSWFPGKMAALPLPLLESLWKVGCISLDACRKRQYFVFTQRFMIISAIWWKS